MEVLKRYFCFHQGGWDENRAPPVGSRPPCFHEVAICRPTHSVSAQGYISGYVASNFAMFLWVRSDSLDVYNVAILQRSDVFLHFVNRCFTC